MNSIQNTLSVVTPAATANVPHERRGELQRADTRHGEAQVLTLSAGREGKAAQAPPGMASLFALLHELQQAGMDEVPARSAQLLAELGRHFLPVFELGNTSKLRSHILGSGVFLEADEAEQLDAAASPSQRAGRSEAPATPTDLKSLLIRLHNLLQPQRQLVLRNGTPLFINTQPVTAQCLQAYADEQKQGSRQRQLHSLLLGDVETALLGIVRDQLQSLAQSSEKKTRWIMELLVRREMEASTVPLTLSRQDGESPELWEAEFELELRHTGPMHVVLSVKNTTVTVSIAAARLRTQEQLRENRSDLSLALVRKGLVLVGFTCTRGQHERRAG